MINHSVVQPAWCPLKISSETTNPSSDIEAMFHQVMVSPNDVDTLRFLWWPDDDLSKEPVEYTFFVARLHQVGTILVFVG